MNLLENPKPPFYIKQNIDSLLDLSNFILDEIKNFFENYKSLQKIEVKVGDYYSKTEALELIKSCHIVK